MERIQFALFIAAEEEIGLEPFLVQDCTNGMKHIWLQR
jgi:hypothetical protein